MSKPYRHRRAARSWRALPPALAVLGGLLAGCGASVPAHTAADTAFCTDMLSHHLQAIAAGDVAAAGAGDPRVRAFGQRVRQEQQPEVERLRRVAHDLGLTPDAAAGARMATDRISDADLAGLRAAPGRQLDRTFLQLSITSETGAVSMARAELAGGRYAPALALARAISSAGDPGSEIDQLRGLLSATGGS